MESTGAGLEGGPEERKQDRCPSKAPLNAMAQDSGADSRHGLGAITAKNTHLLEAELSLENEGQEGWKHKAINRIREEPEFLIG